MGFALGCLSSLSLLIDAVDAAERDAREYAALAREQGDRFSMARAGECLAMVALQRQQRDRAAALFTQSLTFALDVGHYEVIMYDLMGLAVLAAPAEPERAARYFGAAEALRETAGVAVWPTRRTQYDAALAMLHAALDAPARAAAWAEGRAMTREQAVAYALARDHTSG